jgi:hypothetical protein
MTWRALSYSICFAVVITALSFTWSERGGEFILWPGLVSQGMFNWLLLMIPTGDDFYSLPSKSYLVFNITIYSAVVFAGLLLMRSVRHKLKR